MHQLINTYKNISSLFFKVYYLQSTMFDDKTDTYDTYSVCISMHANMTLCAIVFKLKTSSLKNINIILTATGNENSASFFLNIRYL